jgi:preprotein translocase subunit Sec63
MFNKYGFLILIALVITTLGQDYYKTLGIERDASSREIKRAFKKLGKFWFKLKI